MDIGVLKILFDVKLHQAIKSKFMRKMIEICYSRLYRTNIDYQQIYDPCNGVSSITDFKYNFGSLMDTLGDGWEYIDAYFCSDTVDLLDKSNIFSFDITDVFQLFNLLYSYEGSIYTADRDDYEEILSLVLEENYPDETSEEYSDTQICVDDVMNAFDSYRVNTLTASNSELMKDFSRFSIGRISPEAFAANVDLMAKAAFTSRPELPHMVYFLSSKKIAAYLNIRNLLPDDERVLLVDQAVHLLSHPFGYLMDNWGEFCTETYLCEKWYTILIVEGLFGDQTELSLSTAHPFYQLIAQAIEELIPALLEEYIINKAA